MIVALERIYYTQSCRTDHVRWFRLVCRFRYWVEIGALYAAVHVTLGDSRLPDYMLLMWIMLEHLHLLWDSNVAYSQAWMAYSQAWMAYFGACLAYLYIRIYVYFLGNYTCFTARGYKVLTCQGIHGIRHVLYKLYTWRVTQQNRKKYPWRIKQVFLLILGNDKASTFQSIEDQNKFFFSCWAMTRQAHFNPLRIKASFSHLGNDKAYTFQV